MGKKVLKLGLMFLFFGIILIFTVSTVLAFVAPAFMAQTFEKLNMKSLAYGCYDRQYRNSDKVDQQYVMFTKAVDISFNSHIVYYGEKLFQNEYYLVLIANIDKNNISKTEKYIEENPTLTENEKIRLQILSRNEDNFIVNSYVKALVNLNKTEKAKSFLVNNISQTIKAERFGQDTSFGVINYIEKVKILPDDLLLQVEELLNKFEESFVYDIDDIQLADRVCFQRLTEISSCLSTHYKNCGDNEKSAFYFQKAQSYLSLIYS